MSAARALRSVSRFLIHIEDPTAHGSPTSSASKRSLTVLRAMYTSVQDACVRTRLSAPSDNRQQESKPNGLLFLHSAAVGAGFPHAQRENRTQRVRGSYFNVSRWRDALLQICYCYSLRRPTFSVLPEKVDKKRRFVLASSISLVPPHAAGLVHSAARPLQNANASLVCILVLSCAHTRAIGERNGAFSAASLIAF